VKSLPTVPQGRELVRKSLLNGSENYTLQGDEKLGRAESLKQQKLNYEEER